MKIIANQYLNHISRPNTVITSSSLDSKFPPRNLGDSRLDTYSKFRALADDQYWQGDTQLLRNGGAEQGLIGWKKINAPTASTVQKNSGLKSFRLEVDESLNGDEIFQDISSRSDEFMRISAYCRGDAANVSTFVTIRNMQTGRYLQANGTWADTIAYLGINLTAAFVAFTLTFQVEPFSETLHHLTTLRVSAGASGPDAGTGYVDDIVLIPATDFCGVFGFNFPTRMSPVVSSSDTGLFAGEQVVRFTMEARQPAFSSILGTRVYARFWRLVLPGTPIVKHWISEWILGQTVTFTRSARFGSGVTAEWLFPPPNAKQTRQTRLKTISRPQRTLRLQFRFANEAEYLEYSTWLILRCRGENEDIVVRFDEEDEVAVLTAPEMDTGLVIFGGIQGPRGHSLQVPDVRDALDLLVQEDRLPRIA